MKNGTGNRSSRRKPARAPLLSITKSHMTRPGFETGPLRWEVGDYFLFFYYLVCEAIDIAATPGLLCQPLVIVKMIVEKQMECTLAGETEVLGKNLPQRHLCPSQNPTWQDPGLNPGRRGGKPATNRLSYGAAFRKNILPSSSVSEIYYASNQQNRVKVAELGFYLLLVNYMLPYLLSLKTEAICTSET
jgi:hypothetical protein